MHSNPHARTLRRQSTPQEQCFWSAVRNRRLDGFKFRRQHAIGPYIADFACLERKLVVELDGPSHDIAYQRDQRRDAWLASQGYRVIRILNDDARSNFDGVLETIRLALAESV
jgi:very-short-patch-repair endonuclease